MTTLSGLSHTDVFVLTGVEVAFLVLPPGPDVVKQALMTYFGGRNDTARTLLVANLV